MTLIRPKQRCINMACSLDSGATPGSVGSPTELLRLGGNNDTGNTNTGVIIFNDPALPATSIYEFTTSSELGSTVRPKISGQYAVTLGVQITNEAGIKLGITKDGTVLTAAFATGDAGMLNFLQAVTLPVATTITPYVSAFFYLSAAEAAAGTGIIRWMGNLTNLVAYPKDATIQRIGD